MLNREIFGDLPFDDDAILALVSLTQQIFTDVEREIKLTGFWECIPALNELKADIQKTLLQTDFSKLPDRGGRRMRSRTDGCEGKNVAG